MTFDWQVVTAQVEACYEAALTAHAARAAQRFSGPAGQRCPVP
jgi:hypothetical protein